jgi:hypothetical protein
MPILFALKPSIEPIIRLLAIGGRDYFVELLHQRAGIRGEVQQQRGKDTQYQRAQRGGP